MSFTSIYKKVAKQSKLAKLLSGVSALLSWDQETYMPKEAAPIRGEELEVIAGLTHQARISKAFSNPLGKLIDLSSGKILAKDLNERQKAALREWRKDWKKEISLPKSFVENFAKTTSQALQVWQQARKISSFPKFSPILEKVVDLCRKKADFLGYTSHPYDALLDEYEPGITTQEVTTLFSELKPALTKLLTKILATQGPKIPLPKGPFSEDKQVKLSHELLALMGYDFSRGRLDFSTHPFSSSSHPRDSRITTRIDLTSPLSNILTILHEGGHALYEMGLPEEDFGTPLAEAISFGIHESQSRWWETRIGLSKPFWQFFFPKIQNLFPKEFGSFSPEMFWKAIHHVEPSFIRVEADEVTYALHVILRFEIEVALIEGSLKTKDIPAIWNEKMKQFLHITPKTDAEGCLQDVHWAMGGFGYFPSYVLGNLFASHLFVPFSNQFPDWETSVSQGKLLFIKEWLKNNIHRFGRQFTSQELLHKISHTPFSAKAHINYLTTKYTHRE